MSPHRTRPLLRAAAAALAVAGLGLAAPARAADPIAGTWQQIDEDGDVGAWIALSVDKGRVGGRIVKLFPGPGESAEPLCEACRGALHGKPVLGLPIIQGLKPEGRHYAGGRILDPDSGEDYDLEADLAADGQTLTIKAYRGVTLLGRTQTWRRAP